MKTPKGQLVKDNRDAFNYTETPLIYLKNSMEEVKKMHPRLGEDIFNAYTYIIIKDKYF